MRQLAIVTTHPIQYYAPVFKLLHQRGNIAVKVFYTWGKASVNKYDPGFNKTISWDVSILDDYPFEWPVNTAKQPGSHHFNGIINPNLITEIKQFNPDAILFIGWAYHSHLKTMRYFKNRVPLYFRGDSTLLDEPGGLKGLLRNIYLKWVYRHINYTFYTGANSKAYFMKFGLRNEQLIFAPHAVDNDRFSATRHREAEAFKNNLGVGEDDILIVYAAKFEEKKDPLLLIDAFLQLSCKRCHLLFVGNGPLEDVMKQKVQNSENIHLMDFQNQSYMPVILQACDLFCLPSKGPGESWGLAVNEAMACEKAVLVSDKVGCAVDLVKPDMNGDIFKNGDCESLLQSLTKLTQSKQLLHQYGKNSGVMIQQWNFTKIAEAIENKLMA
jgi:glycosyltransferase involved in cell wall biosynthesis